MRSGSRHLVDTCTLLIVAHRHARTSSHSAERLNLCLSGKRVIIHVFTCPCFRSPVHGSGAKLRTTPLFCCSGIVSRWLRRKNDWSSWNGHCSRLGLHCKQRTTGLRLWNQRQVQQHRTTPTATTPSASVVDMRGLGKPSNFAGDEASWKSWSFVMLSFSAAVSPELRALMEKVRKTADDMRNVNLTPAEQVWSRQLYYTLSLSTSGEAQEETAERARG